MKKNIISLLLLVLIAFNALAEEIVVLYDNDVHCAVNGYSKMGALRDEMAKNHKYVTTVSSGDFIQGDIIGANSKGDAIVTIMNSVGYDIVTLGNHEFDYGVPQLMELSKELKASIVSCNFRSIDKTPVFPTYVVKEYGSRHVAFIGITTPNTISSSLPSTFLDKKGDAAYTFCWDDLAEVLQNTVDELRTSGVDYIILLSHIGIEPDSRKMDIRTLAAATSGIDIILDGHSHSVIPQDKIKNVNGEEVILSQTGTRFANIGRLTISDDGDIRTELIPLNTINGKKAATEEIITKYNKELSSITSRMIGKSRVTLTINAPNGERAVRNAETNFGDLVADAMRMTCETDVAFINGGSIRTDIPAGNITYGLLCSAYPFDNKVITAHATGAKILDILEASVAFMPEESGAFLQVSGITFDVDTTIPSPVVFTKDGFVKGINGTRRISNVRIWNSAERTFETIDPTHNYSICSIDYTLLNRGCHGSFGGCTLDGKTQGQLIEIVEEYITKNLSGSVGEEFRKPANRIRIKK